MQWKTEDRKGRLGLAGFALARSLGVGLGAFLGDSFGCLLVGGLHFLRLLGSGNTREDRDDLILRCYQGYARWQGDIAGADRIADRGHAAEVHLDVLRDFGRKRANLQLVEVVGQDRIRNLRLVMEVDRHRCRQNDPQVRSKEVGMDRDLPDRVHLDVADDDGLLAAFPLEGEKGGMAGPMVKPVELTRIDGDGDGLGQYRPVHNRRNPSVAAKLFYLLPENGSGFGPQNQLGHVAILLLTPTSVASPTKIGRASC